VGVAEARLRAVVMGRRWFGRSDVCVRWRRWIERLGVVVDLPAEGDELIGVENSV
jgi:hypothetical protein